MTVYHRKSIVTTLRKHKPKARAVLSKRSRLKRTVRPSFVPAKFVATSGEGRTVAKYRKNQRIFSQGDMADAVFFVQRGRIKLTVVSEHGKEAVVAILNANEFFGEGCLSGQPLRIATARAMADCEITRIEKDVLIRTLRKEPSLSTMFLDYVLKRTIRVEADLVDQLFNSSEKRLARALLMLANFGKEGEPEQIVAKLSQETLAEMIGTTRSRVSSFMNKFRRLGFVRYSGGTMEVHSSLLSVILNDIPPHIKSEDCRSKDN